VLRPPSTDVTIKLRKIVRVDPLRWVEMEATRNLLPPREERSFQCRSEPGYPGQLRIRDVVCSLDAGGAQKRYACRSNVRDTGFSNALALEESIELPLSHILLQLLRASAPLLIEIGQRVTRGDERALPLDERLVASLGVPLLL